MEPGNRDVFTKSEKGDQMRFQRVLFIIPNLKWFYGYPNYPHLGVGYIIELLEEHGIKCCVVDMTLGIKLSCLRRKIREFNPDLIGVTLYSYRCRYAYQLISQIKRITNQPVVIGGPHVSLMKGKALEESGADFAITHEGEHPLLEVCLGKHFEEIDNLIYRDEESIKENPSRPFIKNVDDLPFPKYFPFELEKYGERSIAIISSRGCPYQCIYCPVKTTMGRGLRLRSPESIISELKYWYSRGYRHFDFNDDVFNVNKRRVYEICDLIEKENFTAIFLSCGQGMRMDKVDRPLLERMKEVGFYRIGFGVESFNNRILQSIKKGITTEQIDEGVRIACELGYDVTLFFMLGFPGETWTDIQNSLNFSLKYPVTMNSFYNIIPYPGTDLFNFLQENKLLLVNPDAYLNRDMTRSRKILFQNDSMSMVERRKALELGERFTRRCSSKHMGRRLGRLGIFGKFLAWLLCTKLMWHLRIELDGYGPTYRLRLLVMKLLGLRKR